jgi:hypothetical protein
MISDLVIIIPMIILASICAYQASITNSNPYLASSSVYLYTCIYLNFFLIPNINHH